MIYITGAGCGDFRLLTLQAKHVIEQADCILYDRLLDPSILTFAKSSCECIYVGKRNHHHTLKQEQINALLVEKGKQYPIVVRLKGGDPYVFGRGSEEALSIREAGLDFEMIPGVTSAIAGCAYAGIPVTHRGVAQGICMISAHTKEDVMADLDFASMVNSKDTLVFFMGLANITSIVQGLCAAGKDVHTPIALISHGARYCQTCVCATLETILTQDLASIVSPAIIVVGDVVAYRAALNFYEQKPLFGKHYLLAAIQDDIDLRWSFHEQGAMLETISCGYIDWNFDAVQEETIKSCTHVLFTSRNAVKGFFEQLYAKKLDARALAHVVLCAIGEKTAAAVQTYGCRCDLISPQADSEHFAQFMNAHIQADDRVLLPKAKNHNHVLRDRLSSACTIVEIPLYETKETPIDIKEQAVNGILFTCSFSVHALMKHVVHWKHFEDIAMYAMGEPTKRALQTYGCQHIITLKDADRHAFLDAVYKEEHI